jgi:hypothetical protein
MRLGKEQAIGVVEVPAGADSVVRDGPGAADADQQRLAEEVVAEASPVSGRSEQGALIRSR